VEWLPLVIPSFIGLEKNAVNSVNPVWNLPSPHAKGAVLGIVHFDGARILTQSVCIDPGLP
jgi:hypothetical protein